MCTVFKLPAGVFQHFYSSIHYIKPQWRNQRQYHTARVAGRQLGRFIMITKQLVFAAGHR